MSTAVIAHPTSPYRCQYVQDQERCKYTAEVDSRFCQKHSSKHSKRIQRETLNRYRVQAFQGDLDAIVSRSDLKSLRTEIAACHVIAEQLLQICKSDDDILTNSYQLVMVMNTITSLVLATARIELECASLMDKGILFDLVEIMLTSSERYILQKFTPQGKEYAQKVLIQFTDHVMNRVAIAMGSDIKIAIKADINTTPQMRLTFWDAELKKYYQSPNIYSLKSEIALARVVLQSLLNVCCTPARIIHEHTKILSTIETIRKLCLAANFVDKNTGNLIDRSTLVMLAESFSRDLAVVIDDQYMPELVETLNHEYSRLISAQGVTTEMQTFQLPDDSSAAAELLAYTESEYVDADSRD